MTRELLDSFWRAAAYCLHPKVIALSLLPLAIVGGAAVALGYWFWEPAVADVRGIGCYFANNSAGALALDIYNVTWFASLTLPWDMWLVPPPLQLTPMTPSGTTIISMAPDHAQPAGAVGMFTAGFTPGFRLQRISSTMNFQSLQPIAGSFWMTLPPGWIIAVSANAGTNACEMSMTVWYQEVLDNIAPAR